MPNSTKDTLNAQIHAGRRQKLRDRFLDNGLETFNECEVLEFALGFCIPRQDTNPAAHSLLNHFGSLRAVLDAKPSDLIAAYGIGEQAAVFLHFLKQMTSYLAKQDLGRVKIDTPDDAINLLAPLLRSYSVEQFVVACLDNAGKVIKVYNITNHELDMVHVNVREIISVVTATKTAQVVLAHNHLNDDPSPSLADMQLTRRLMLTFQNLGIKFLDHVIFAGEQNYSFHCTGLLEILKS
ncbi:MAG: hypothetical protein NC133_03000 [Prevotella sp.]|nr:hypothetical protein [Prevotella sp.]